MQTQIRLPEGWEVRKLGDTAKIIMGQSPPSKTYNSEGKGLPFFQGKAEFGDMHPTPKKWCSEPKKVANKNDILISVRAPVGPVNLSDSKCCIGRGLCAIRTKLDKLNYNYLYNFLKSQEDILSKRGQGSTFTAIRKKDVFEIKIPIPFPNDPQKSLEKQQKIVARLDAFFEHYNELKKEKQKAKEKYEQIIQSVIASLIPQKELPDGWEEKKIGDKEASKKITSGGTPLRGKKEYWENGTIPWLKSGELEDDYIENTKEKITEKGLKKSSAKFFNSNTVLIALYGATVGKTGILKIRSTTNQAICGITPNENKLYYKYLFYFLQSKRQYLVSKSFGGAQPNISQKLIKELDILLPDVNKQKQIVRVIENIKEKIKSIEQQQKNIDYQLEQLPKAVLSKAFRGELVS